MSGTICFGPDEWARPWGEYVDTPVGAPCLRCDEPIADGDSGEIVPLVQPCGITMHAWHRECRVRAILGSVGHQLQMCSCHGGDLEDPPGLTRRQAAQLAFDVAMRKVSKEQAACIVQDACSGERKP